LIDFLTLNINTMQRIKKYVGLVAAPFTPMDKKGNLNTDLIPRYYEFLEKNGVVGAFINGSTGEGPSLTQKEAHRQASKWTECLKKGGKVRIINLVGGTSLNECIENAIFSYESGLSAIAVLPPYYYKTADENVLAEFCTRIGESVPYMPLYFYHIPDLTGIYIPMIRFLEKISAMLPNFAGIKYSNEDFMDFLTCLNYRDGVYDILWGLDECLLPALALGCEGCVGSTYNYAAPLYHKLVKEFNAGNLEEAQRIQQLSINIISLLGKYGGLGTGKAFMRYVGIDCGEFRLPVKNLTSKMYEDFVKDVELLKMSALFSKL